MSFLTKGVRWNQRNKSIILSQLLQKKMLLLRIWHEEKWLLGLLLSATQNCNGGTALWLSCPSWNKLTLGGYCRVLVVQWAPFLSWIGGTPPLLPDRKVAYFLSNKTGLVAAGSYVGARPWKWHPLLVFSTKENGLLCSTKLNMNKALPSQKYI